MTKRWTKKEVEIIKSDMPIKDMAETTGRTIISIYRKRAELKRGFCAAPVDEDSAINPYNNLTQQEKEERIYNLADRLMVKIVR